MAGASTTSGRGFSAPDPLVIPGSDRRALGRWGALLSLLVGCGAPRSEDPKGDARMIWETRCVNCHGVGGRGDGPAGTATSPRPRDFTDRSWQATIDDRGIRNAILYGGAGVGLNPAMAANPDLREKVDVTEALVQIVRDFGRTEDAGAPTPARP